MSAETTDTEMSWRVTGRISNFYFFFFLLTKFGTQIGKWEAEDKFSNGILDFHEILPKPKLSLSRST